jgi:hypothetical protein
MTLSRTRDGYLRREKSVVTTDNGTGVQIGVFLPLSDSFYDDWCIRDAVETERGILESLYTEPEVTGWVLLTQWMDEKLTNAEESM